MVLFNFMKENLEIKSVEEAIENYIEEVVCLEVNECNEGGYENFLINELGEIIFVSESTEVTSRDELLEMFFDVLYCHFYSRWINTIDAMP